MHMQRIFISTLTVFDYIIIAYCCYSPFSSKAKEFRSFRRNLRLLLGAAIARKDSMVA